MDNLLLITINCKTGESIVSASQDADFNATKEQTIDTLKEVIDCLEELEGEQ